VNTATIHLVRHGRTALNAQGRFRGRQNPPLDERGLVEVSETAHRLAHMRLAAVYASPLLRTLQTAEFIAGPSSTRVITTPELIDLDHGRWEGLTPQEAAAMDPDEFARFRASPREARPPGGEPMSSAESRILSVLTEIGARHVGRHVAAVTHEIPIRLATAHLARIQDSKFWDATIPTGGVLELRFSEGVLDLVTPLRAPGSAVTWFCPHCFAEVGASVEVCPSCGGSTSTEGWNYERKLVAALDHHLSDRRLLAARILGRLRAESAVRRLAELAVDPSDPYLAAEAAASLAHIDPEHPLVRDLDQGGPLLVRTAIREAWRSA
jgi:broad specificity phosphatase PhoE